MPSTEKRAEELASGRETMKGNNHARRFLHCIGRRARVFKSERRHYRKERERERDLLRLKAQRAAAATEILVDCAQILSHSLFLVARVAAFKSPLAENVVIE